MLEKLQSASFRGVSFLVDSASTEGGRKTVTHEYPNTNIRFVEDLGDLQETFSINGIITGANYIQDRDSLIAALKMPGRGELVHPFFGTLMVVAKPYSLAESMNELGVAKFTMIFEKSDESIFPSQSSSNTSLINSRTNILTGLLGNDLSSLFSVSRKYPSNFVSAKNILTAVGTAFGINADNVLKVVDNISSFSSNLLNFTTDINDNIVDPTSLTDDFELLFSSFSQIGRNAVDQFDLLQSLFGYGDDESAIPTTTVQRLERETNRQIINSYVNANALAYAYNTVPQLDFTTENDIKEIQGILDTQFDYVIENSNLGDDSIQAIKDLRVEVIKFLENESVTAFKIATITTQELPMTILCHQYYGSVDNTVNLLNLNNTIDSSFVVGDVNILVN
jgi:prophage DNA circulation protein